MWKVELGIESEPARLVEEGLVDVAKLREGFSPRMEASLPGPRSRHRVSHFTRLRQSPVQYLAHQETTLLATHLTPSIIITMVMVALTMVMTKWNNNLVNIMLKTKKIIRNMKNDSMFRHFACYCLYYVVLQCVKYF